MQLSRRSLITGGPALVGLGIGGVVGRESTPSHSPAPITAGEALMTEHGVLKRVLLVYRATGEHLDQKAPFDRASVAASAEVIRDFIEGFHELTEESHVFPALPLDLTDTVNTLLFQHGRGRQLTERIISLTTGQHDDTVLADHLAAFVRMYEPHEAREDTVIFPALRTALGDDRLADLGTRIQREQRQKFGSDAVADVLAKVGKAEDALGISDLAQFTPTEDSVQT
jgi:hemerythrin-like domain-containing protein